MTQPGTTKAKRRRASGNVFRDLGFPAQEADGLRLRAELMVRVRKLIGARGLTRHAAARLFGVTQPRVSNLLCGKIDLFSIDALVDMLARAGARMHPSVRPDAIRARRPAAT